MKAWQLLGSKGFLIFCKFYWFIYFYLKGRMKEKESERSRTRKQESKRVCTCAIERVFYLMAHSLIADDTWGWTRLPESLEFNLGLLLEWEGPTACTVCSCLSGCIHQRGDRPEAYLRLKPRHSELGWEHLEWYLNCCGMSHAFTKKKFLYTRICRFMLLWATWTILLFL